MVVAQATTIPLLISGYEAHQRDQQKATPK